MTRSLLQGLDLGVGGWLESERNWEVENVEKERVVVHGLASKLNAIVQVCVVRGGASDYKLSWLLLGLAAAGICLGKGELIISLEQNRPSIL